MTPEEERRAINTIEAIANATYQDDPYREVPHGYFKTQVPPGYFKTPFPVIRHYTIARSYPTDRTVLEPYDVELVAPDDPKSISAVIQVAPDNVKVVARSYQWKRTAVHVFPLKIVVIWELSIASDDQFKNGNSFSHSHGGL